MEPENEQALILLVDDQPKNLQVAGALLREHGYQLAIATNGKDAIESAKEEPPALILLDVMMPEMDGFTACRTLKQIDTLKDVPVIFLTAKTEVEDIKEGFDAGGVDYITKPFNPDELLARVDTHVRLWGAQQHLRALSEMKSEFLGMAAHDLKNPLWCISAQAAMLIEEMQAEGKLEGAENLENIQEIEGYARKMFSMVEEILNAEAIDSGRMEFTKDCVDLTEIIDEVVAMNLAHASKKGIDIIFETDQTAEAWVSHQRMREVFDNLLSNAVKYSDTGKRVWVDITKAAHAPAAELDGMDGEPVEGINATPEVIWHITVRDEGQGIPAEELPQLFSRFKKLSPRPTAGESSTGLGLSIAKSLVEKHGGTLRCESEEGKGTSFIIELPEGSDPAEETLEEA